MHPLNVILATFAIVVASPVHAETRPQAPPRPLNLSLPRDALQGAGTPAVDDTVQRNLRAPQPPVGAPPPPASLRYGTGYEQRMLEMGGASPAVGGGSGAGAGASAGRRGR